MPTSRTDLVRRSYRAFREGDLDGLLVLYHPDATWDLTRWAGYPDRAVFRGREGVEQLFRMLQDVFGEFEVHPGKITEVGEDMVLIEALMKVRGKVSGAEVGAPPLWQVGEFRDGLIFRIDMYSDVAAARRALGLSPTDSD